MNPVDLFWKKSKGAIDVALRRTIDHIRINTRELILARLTPSGGPQTGPGDLIGEEGLLSSPSRYRIVRKGQWDYILYPPPARARVIEELRIKGYQLFEIPHSSVDWLEKYLEEDLNK